MSLCLCKQPDGMNFTIFNLVDLRICALYPDSLNFEYTRATTSSKVDCNVNDCDQKYVGQTIRFIKTRFNVVFKTNIGQT